MHITPESAGLLAQVYPTLLIAILLEGRIRKGDPTFGLLGKFEFVVRFFAILGATMSTFLCLVVHVYQQGSEFTDGVVIVSAGLLLLSIISVATNVLAQDFVHLFVQQAKPSSEGPEPGREELSV